ncbi:transporter substrate-binding protein [Caenispirillum bisanense]|uniref:Urea transport system substrate-binding protein n=1 Tax=Caenispirillum bisanense TaxID=414052 RepID=A0A286GA27_9PROT|nr:transporter substrate-binding protein [Caenispirillum bisanense]SOD91989.1 urea transport system substrate-binding protein [Caenispirillum bisanense]
MVGPTRRGVLSGLAALAAAGAAGAPVRSGHAAPPIRVGILHSLTGTMAISESTLKDVLLMLIDRRNQAGGLLGRRIEPVVVDPASSWPRYAQLAEHLLGVEGCDVLFGCYASASRKIVQPVLERHGALLFYPAPYEGQEQSPDVVYLGATPQQQAVPAVEYLLSADGGGVRRFYLLGSDDIHPRTVNTILAGYLDWRKLPREDFVVRYVPFGATDWAPVVNDIRAFARGGKTAVINTVSGDANLHFYRELVRQEVHASDIPVVAFAVGEQELASVDVTPLVGHLTAATYFMSLETPENEAFVRDWQAWIGDDLRVVSAAMADLAAGFALWTKAVEMAGSPSPEVVKITLRSVSTRSLGGDVVALDGATNHVRKPVMIGEIQATGQMMPVWLSDGPVDPVPWSRWWRRGTRILFDGALP